MILTTKEKRWKNWSYARQKSVENVMVHEIMVSFVFD